MKYKFYVKEVPDPYTVWNWIQKNTNIDYYIKKLKSNVDSTKLLTLNHQFDISKLSKIVISTIKQYGFKGWRTSLGEAKHYGGLSLTYNPDYSETCDLSQQTLGTEKNLPSQFFYGQVENFNSTRNTYFDCYGFRKFAPCVAETELKEIISSFKRSIVRSRIGVINSKYVTDDMRSQVGWHRDETVFENLRINVPLKTDDTFMFELEGHRPEHLALGNMYSWDTNIPHRVFPTTSEPRHRVHLVFGFSPWFDYIEEEDAFVSNEFYGEMHPIDMLINGHIHDKIYGLK